MSGTSPAWKNPRERLVKHVKRKSSMRLVMPTVSSSSFDDIATESCPPMTVTSLRSSNPFKIASPTKKRAKFDIGTPTTPGESFFDWDDSTANDSFSTVATSKMSQATHLSRSMSAQVNGDSSLLDFSALGGIYSASPSQSPAVAAPAVEQRYSETIPRDARLGTKLRITSKVPLPWMKNAKSTGNILVRMNGMERSHGMQCFLDVPEKSGRIEPSTRSYSSNAILEAACLYWQYPSLPWLSLFPRFDGLLKTLPKQSAPPMAPTMVEIIAKQWSESLEQLFMSWKKGERGKFYVVCPTFTVHFCKTDRLENEACALEDSMSCFQVSDGQQHVAVISPTNMAFRQHLKQEGVDFELCSYKKRRLSKVKFDENSVDSGDFSLASAENSRSCGSNDSNDAATTNTPGKENNGGEEEKEINEEESPTKGNVGDHEWLKDIGFSPKHQLKLRRHRSMVSTVTTKSSKGPGKNEIEKDETSAVIVTGSSLQALYNVLQTSKVTKAIAGPHANLPPTLLAEKPFLFAQMMTLKKSSQVLKRPQSTEFIVELDGGPVMPHCVELAASFARSAQLVEKEPASLRVNDRTACAGLNGVESSSEWHEIKIEKSEFSWNVRTS